MSETQGGLLPNKPHVAYYEILNSAGEPYLQPLLTQRADEEHRGAPQIPQYVCNDFSPKQLDQHAYRLTEPALKS